LWILRSANRNFVQTQQKSHPKVAFCIPRLPAEQTEELLLLSSGFCSVSGFAGSVFSSVFSSVNCFAGCVFSGVSSGAGSSFGGIGSSASSSSGSGASGSSSGTRSSGSVSSRRSGRSRCRSGSSRSGSGRSSRLGFFFLAASRQGYSQKRCNEKRLSHEVSFTRFE
jgi:hypothetical protein